MTAPASQQEYLITKSELDLLEWRESDGRIPLPDGSNLITRIRSRPVKSPIPNDEQCRICSQELIDWIKNYQAGKDSAYMEVVLTPVVEHISSLRSSSPRSRES